MNIHIGDIVCMKNHPFALFKTQINLVSENSFSSPLMIVSGRAFDIMDRDNTEIDHAGEEKKGF